MRYTQYRGLAQVTNWVKLKFAAMNLKKLKISAKKKLQSHLHYRRFMRMGANFRQKQLITVRFLMLTTLVKKKLKLYPKLRQSSLMV